MADKQADKYLAKMAAKKAAKKAAAELKTKNGAAADDLSHHLAPPWHKGAAVPFKAERATPSKSAKFVFLWPRTTRFTCTPSGRGSEAGREGMESVLAAQRARARAEADTRRRQLLER